MDKFTKQSWEAFVISGSCADDLSDGESVVLISSSVSAIDNTGEDATSTVLNVAGLALEGTDKLLVQVKDGVESASPYYITFKAVTDATPPNKFELDIKMTIKELGTV